MEDNPIEDDDIDFSMISPPMRNINNLILQLMTFFKIPKTNNYLKKLKPNPVVPIIPSSNSLRPKAPL